MEDGSAVSISVPKGFESVNFFSRLCRSGLCTWADIKAKKLDIKGCYELMLLIDFDEMCGLKAKMVK